MFEKLSGTIKSIVAGWARTAAESVKKLTNPGPVHAAIDALVDATRTRTELLAENAPLRQQLVVVHRTHRRPAFRDGDRILMVLLARLAPRWRDALHLVQPDTLLRWHRDLFKIVWRRRSRAATREPRIPRATIELIRKMAADNVSWGAERIRGELLKLGLKVSKRTIRKYMRGVRDPRRPSQSWATFLKSHAGDIWACDFVQTFEAMFRPIFGFLIVEHGSRRVVHFNMTRAPTDAWVAQQLREATPYDEGPRYLIRDNDSKFGQSFAAVAEGAGISVIRTAFHAPVMNSICERFIGSLRRECLDHVLILGEDHMRRVIGEYCRYFNDVRPHQSLAQRTPSSVAIRSATEEGSVEVEVVRDGGEIVSTPVLGGLHHEYRWAA